MTGPSKRIRQIQEEISRHTASPAPSQEKLSLLTFCVGGERFALPLEQIREVCRVTPITPIPGLPSTVLGATGLRGEVLAVIDLHQIFLLEDAPTTQDSRLLVVRYGDTFAALMADRVEDIAEITPEAIRDAPARTAAEEGRPGYIQGVVGTREETIRLIDIEQLMQTICRG